MTNADGLQALATAEERRPISTATLKAENARTRTTISWRLRGGPRVSPDRSRLASPCIDNDSKAFVHDREGMTVTAELITPAALLTPPSSSEASSSSGAPRAANDAPSGTIVGA